MKYTTLLFDADGTLYDFEKAEEKSLESFYSLIQLNCPYKEFKEVYEIENRLLWKAFEEGVVSAGEVKEKRFENTIKKLSLYENNAKELSQLYIEELSKCDFLIPGAKELIECIKDKYVLLIITNGLWDVQKKRIGQSDLYQYFNGLIVSEKVGFAKPDSRIFDRAFAEANHPDKQDVMIIGDSLTSDIRGGVLYGIDTCWINLDGRDNLSDISPTYEVSSFQELKSLL
ncbi:MAG: YjjG family noncanonical pyrimidine nucleotidase [Spirochaetaceae bacterium]|nr:YjjG family noncanonical pyrimidine nucleotidase [Spirochaetaceae bacterium]